MFSSHHFIVHGPHHTLVMAQHSSLAYTNSERPRLVKTGLSNPAVLCCQCGSCCSGMMWCSGFAVADILMSEVGKGKQSVSIEVFGHQESCDESCLDAISLRSTSM